MVSFLHSPMDPPRCAAELAKRTTPPERLGLPKPPRPDELVGEVYEWVPPEVYRFRLFKRRFIFNNLTPKVEGAILGYHAGSVIRIRRRVFGPFVELGTIVVVAIGALVWPGGAGNGVQFRLAALKTILASGAGMLALLALNWLVARAEVMGVEAIILERAWATRAEGPALEAIVRFLGRPKAPA